MGDMQPEEQQPVDDEQTDAGQPGADQEQAQAQAQQPPPQAGDDTGIKPDSLYDH